MKRTIHTNLTQSNRQNNLINSLPGQELEFPFLANSEANSLVDNTYETSNTVIY